MTKINQNSLVHNHLIYQAQTGINFGEESEKELRKFLYDLLNTIDMKCLIPAQLKFSNQKAWTGIIGIITSHVAFHYWTMEKYLQLDIYSCKEFSKEKAIKFVNNFWKSKNQKILFIDRGINNKDFKIEKIQ